MRWVLRLIGLLLAVINAGFFALAFEMSATWQWVAVFLASLAVLVAIDLSWFRMIDADPARASTDEPHV
jgi:hypothetical protein